VKKARLTTAAPDVRGAQENGAPLLGSEMKKGGLK
jgi:hypothetical protein